MRKQLQIEDMASKMEHNPPHHNVEQQQLSLLLLLPLLLVVVIMYYTYYIIASSDVLRVASLRITLTVPEVVGAENWVNSSLPFLFDSSSIDKVHPKSLAAGNR